MRSSRGDIGRAAPAGWVYKPPKLDDALDAAKKAALHAAKHVVKVLAPGAELRVEPLQKVTGEGASPSGKTKVFRGRTRLKRSKRC